MRLIGALNIQSSLLISGISAAGLGVLISLAQVKEPDPFAIPETSPYHKTEKNQNPTPTQHKGEDAPKDLQTFSVWTSRSKSVLSEELGPDSGIKEDREFSFLRPGIGNGNPFSFRNTTHATPDFLWNDSNQTWTGSNFLGGRQGNLQVASSIRPLQPFADPTPPLKGRRSDPFGSGDKTGVNQSTLDALELSYTLVPGVEAILKTGNALPYTSDHKEQGYSMAGFSFKPNEFISTRIVSGSSFGNSSLSSNRVFSASPANPQTMNLDPNIGQNPILRNQAMGSGGGRVIEWQASIQPVKRISFQTSVLNKEKEKGYYNPEAARFSMFIDFTKIILNIRYSYTADPTAKNNGLYITPESDATTLGFTMLLDPAGRYSLFFGNNYYNLMSQRNAGINQVEEPLRSFSASFRGKTGFQNAIFFMNFRNNLSKGVIYTDVGPFRLPAYSQYYTEYFTSLGMELSF